MKLSRFKINLSHFKKKSFYKPLAFILVITAVLWFSNYLINEAVETIWHKSKENLPIYSVETDEKVVSISFDAAWGNEDTQELLDILDKYEIKATFFLVGSWVDKYSEDVKNIYARGHDIGNHSTTHAHMTRISKEQCIKELMDSHKKVQDLLGYDMDLFRPPYGDYNDSLVKTAKECGYYTVQWDVDSLDWKEYGIEHEVKTVLNHKNLQNGSIILFHNDTKYTPQALVPIIEGLLEKGYKIIPISELIIREDYYMDHTGRQKKVKDEL